VEVKAKSTVTLADIRGAGSIRHIWFTINSPSPFHLRELVLRMYWDGETEPSVEVPIGDFFGTGFEMGDDGQKYHSWWSLPITVQDRAMNCYFDMPFGDGARVTLTNDGTQDVQNLYFHIDYQEYPDARRVADKGRFHAQWRHEMTRAVSESESAGKNVDGKNNYVFMEAKGKGRSRHYQWNRDGRLFQQRVGISERVQLSIHRLLAAGQSGLDGQPHHVPVPRRGPNLFSKVPPGND
jgi:hypothetical protein